MVAAAGAGRVRLLQGAGVRLLQGAGEEGECTTAHEVRPLFQRAQRAEIFGAISYTLKNIYSLIEIRA